MGGGVFREWAGSGRCHRQERAGCDSHLVTAWRCGHREGRHKKREDKDVKLIHKHKKQTKYTFPIQIFLFSYTFPIKYLHKKYIFPRFEKVFPLHHQGNLTADKRKRIPHAKVPAFCCYKTLQVFLLLVCRRILRFGLQDLLVFFCVVQQAAGLLEHLVFAEGQLC